VAPARYEPYGLAIHEALSCGLPAFVSARAGIAERYPSDLRILILPDPEDVNDLVMKLKGWRESVEVYHKLVQTFSKHLRSYGWDDMAQSILEKIEGNV
jgi:glycosyltransferase involved in cell wall biosynthesis